ncbi:hypothetical protein M3P05_05060 [Sansalvadorimonas sp. 2012CJ34-2]|uniref:Chromosome partition protein Smc n=1 Tax=Parendozoicomonas callyspongiae TaxID=2942213 RepID=A0ABT0PD58_9GAMM|nr:hypothetical protein [Sansalvadorimonas sp. 2012CJ34-2]MCL6269313.1 hypothetical protein [Sansalvadorimonas sp. 2012CJ34-2]
MNSRSQDDLDKLPSISLSPDDLPDRAADRSRKSAKKVTAKTESQAGSRFPMAAVILSVALLALAGGGYLQLKAVQDDLNLARRQLEETTSRLVEVSGSVSKTDENLSKSDSKVKDELKAINFEIRKLWDLSNKRNRQNIAAQGKRLDAVEKSAKSSVSNIDKAEGQISSLTKQLSTTGKELDTAQNSLAALKKEVRGINAQITAGSAISQEQLDSLSVKMRMLETSLSNTVADNQRLTKNIEARLKESAENDKAFDVHRQQLNRRLLQLENTVRGLNVAQ